MLRLYRLLIERIETMKILAIDTSNQPMAIALVENRNLMATTTLKMVKNHSVYVLPTIDRLMEIVKWTPEDLDQIVVASGPGSYTGIRIAVTTAKVLADTLGINLVTVSSLQVLAANIPPLTNEIIVPFFDARRGTVFAGQYQWQNGSLLNIQSDQHLEMADLISQLSKCADSVVLVGEVTAKLVPLLTDLPQGIRLMTDVSALPSAYQLALLGDGKASVADVNTVVPRYSRRTEAEMNWLQTHPEGMDHDYVQRV